jgi:hypothetical protein
MQRLLTLSALAITAFFFLGAQPTFAQSQVECPSGFENPQDPPTPPYTYKICTAQDGSGNTVRVFTGADGQNAPGDVVTNSSTGGQTFAPQGSEAVESCKADSLAGRIGCVFVDIIIAFIAAFVGVFTTLLQWSVAAFNYSIHASVIEYGQWYAKIQDPITRGWTLFRDLANIGIIGIFVFIAISIILGLHEYGQKKLIARVIIVATLINFSFLFTTIVINASNALATVVYETVLTKDISPDSGPTKGLGDQFLKYLGAASFRNTVNTLTQQYNNKESNFLAVLLYAFFIMLFSIAAAAVFLYGAFLLFARFVILLLLLTLSAAAFATYLWPSLAESGWGAWRTQLLRNSILAPILMLFLLISLDAAQAFAVNKVIGAGATPSFTDMINSPADSTLWAMTFAFLVILGFLFGGMYIASQLASGMASRFASSIPGSLVGAGAGVAAFGGRWGIGRAFDMRAHSKANALKDTERDIAYRKSMNMDTKDLEATARKLRRQEAFASSQAKRTFDLRNTAIGGALKGTGGAFATGTKKNYADIAHAAAEQGAKAGLKVAVDQKTAQKYVSEQARQEFGDVAGAHDKAKQEVDRAKQEISKALLGGEKAALDHERKAEALQKEKEALAAQMTPNTDADTRNRLQMQMTEKDEQIASARVSATTERTSASQRAASLRTSLNLEQKKADLRQKAEAKKQYDSVVTSRAREMVKSSHERAKHVAAENAVGPASQAFYTGTNVLLSQNRAHHAEELVEKKIPYKEKAEAKAALDSFNKSSDHGHAANDNHANGGAAANH